MRSVTTIAKTKVFPSQDLSCYSFIATATVLSPPVPEPWQPLMFLSIYIILPCGECYINVTIQFVTFRVGLFHSV